MSFTSVEFEALLGDDGEIVVPPPLRELHGLGKGSALRVRLTERSLSDRLRERGVSDEEIRRISDLQLESRDRVIAFLLSEGARKKRPGRRKTGAGR